MTVIRAGEVASPTAASAAAAGSPSSRPTKRQKTREDYRINKKEDALPQKRFFRQRAHANPFSDHDLE